MARAYNQVGRAREARLQNMGLTCDASLARNLPSYEPSRLRDRPRSQVEAVVLQVPTSRSSEPWTARTIFLHQLFCLLSDSLALIYSIHNQFYAYIYSLFCFIPISFMAIQNQVISHFHFSRSIIYIILFLISIHHIQRT